MRRRYIFVFLSLVTSVAQSQYNFDLVNTVYDEQCPIISPDGEMLFFTRANHPGNVGGITDKGDIWYSTLVGEQWSVPVQAGSTINNKQWNGVLGFSNNGKTMILHHHYQDGKQGLSISQKNGNSWSSPTTLKIPYFLNHSKFQSGSISNDGKIIVLSIESYNTKGGEDIYVIAREADGTWSDAKNLGTGINTKYQELTPYLAKDNKTLFFASNGHSNSIGSFDIYKSVRQDDTWINWSTPEILNDMVNTTGRESSYQYFADSKTAIYISTLDSDGYGDFSSIKKDEDIQEVVKIKQDTVDTALIVDFVPPLLIKDSIPRKEVLGFYFTGSIIDVNSGALLDGSLLLTPMDGEEQLPHEVKNGKFSIPLEVGNYHLRVESKEYFSKFLTIQIDTVVTRHQIAMAPIVVGETVNLKSVLFGRATDALLPSSYDELDAVVKMMKENPKVEILLGGHTDNQGSSKLNYKLSENRVDAVKKYLQSKGISGRRIEGKGYGGSRPIASNKNEETRKLNRRVEFTVTKK